MALIWTEKFYNSKSSGNFNNSDNDFPNTPNNSQAA